jgi:hypothetical protein
VLLACAEAVVRVRVGVGVGVGVGVRVRVGVRVGVWVRVGVGVRVGDRAAGARGGSVAEALHVALGVRQAFEHVTTVTPG